MHVCMCSVTSVLPC
uniref:Uncharacterized protein n=1 Tax=Arundo donax TaxID=35708 RepID=A0A0A9FL40_ARUDO